MNTLQAITGNVWVPITGICLMLAWAIFWPKKTKVPYYVALERKTWEIFKRINDCPHLIAERITTSKDNSWIQEPCGQSSTGGTRLCDRAYANRHRARAMAREELTDEYK